MEKYEGAEKLLEVWFFYDKDRTSLCCGCPDLRELKSESSLFITENRIILKTCGQTQILQSLKPLIQYAMRLGFAQYVVYYSRRSFLFPELQVEPHGDFRNEISVLDKFCKRAGYTFGRLNGDCWNFYCGQSTLAQMNEPPGQTLEVGSSNHDRYAVRLLVEIFASTFAAVDIATAFGGCNSRHGQSATPYTVVFSGEVFVAKLMMRGLNPARMGAFYARTSHSAEEATKCSGIANLFPHGRVSSYLFTPCGYSANGLMNEDEYFTVHVTPEPEFSYASFETNVAMDNYPAFISRILDIFQPESFICTFFSDAQSSTYSTHAILEKVVTLSNYCRSDLHSACMECGRKLTFMKYFRVNNQIEGANVMMVTEKMGLKVDSVPS
ncbi:unnamed protein product [Taenia asiatica]|uniref:Adenosylmethionine decarboxylase n=1 Tax=Taenia asiatica TaxID=60517 RepID=A0A0R3VWB1_TAEAS|nr:unnamed protein product [Taenia asiatica]